MQTKNMHRAVVLILLIEFSIAYVLTAAPLLRKTKYYKNARLMHDCIQCIYLITYASLTRRPRSLVPHSLVPHSLVPHSLIQFTALSTYLALPP